MENRPRGRQKNITGQGKDIKRRGAGLGTGPVGKPGRTPRPAASGGQSSRGTTRSGGDFGGSKLIMLILVLLLGGGGGMGALLSGGDSTPAPQPQQPQISAPGSAASLEQLLGGLGGGSVSSGWDAQANTQTLDTTVAKGARDKYTELLGGGRDEVTLMVYLCGTDLESRSQMATMDLQEMLDAEIGDNVNLIVYTGGCRQWRNNVLDSSKNQIWQVKDDGLV